MIFIILISVLSVVIASNPWIPGYYDLEDIRNPDYYQNDQYAWVQTHLPEDQNKLDWFPEDEVPGINEVIGVHNGREYAKSFLNEWTVEVAGSEEVAQLVALELGYVYGGPVVGFPNMYRFLRYEHEKHRRTPKEHTYTLIKDRRVRWVEQLFAKSRVKRSPIPDSEPELHRVKRLEQEKRDSILFGDRSYMRQPLFNDELWGHEWYLQDTRTAHNLPRLDLNVLPVYRMGFNGSGVRVTVLDDGIEHNHTDLRDNYDAEISWDSNDGDPDPSPRYAKIMTNSHGTRCAGEIAMTANNIKCGVGVAWGAKVGGVRMLDGRITDRVEGEAIAYAADKVDIYSASWGPNDDGRTVEGPGRLALEAFKKGVTTGRGGKGAIYVWANGNGGGHDDNCNCDGYSSSIYTVSIGSASQHGKFPWYGEICSSTLAVAYSSGAYKDQKIATTDTSDSCTLKHTGTSAAAPLAAGILALALQANPHLTWRDVQHLIVWTSDFEPLSANPGWQVNGIGLHFDIRFGFGLLNAGSIVNAALNWTTVPSKHTCRFESPLKENLISSPGSVEVEIAVDGCAVNFLEHVEAVVNVRHSRRGALEIYLTSPQGTRVNMLSARPRDVSRAGFVNWPLMSVATWGENPRGVWTLTVQDLTPEDNKGKVGPIILNLHGTAEMPVHMQTGPTWTTVPSWGDPQEYEEVDPSVLTEVENELQRMNHRNEYSLIGI